MIVFVSFHKSTIGPFEKDQALRILKKESCEVWLASPTAQCEFKKPILLVSLWIPETADSFAIHTPMRISTISLLSGVY
jgi:hypothetical protein